MIELFQKREPNLPFCGYQWKFPERTPKKIRKKLDSSRGLRGNIGIFFGNSGRIMVKSTGNQGSQLEKKFITNV